METVKSAFIICDLVRNGLLAVTPKFSFVHVLWHLQIVVIGDNGFMLVHTITGACFLCYNLLCLPSINV